MVPNRTCNPPNPWGPNLRGAAYVPNCPEFAGLFFRIHGWYAQRQTFPAFPKEGVPEFLARRPGSQLIGCICSLGEESKILSN